MFAHEFTDVLNSVSATIRTGYKNTCAIIPLPLHIHLLLLLFARITGRMYLHGLNSRMYVFTLKFTRSSLIIQSKFKNLITFFFLSFFDMAKRIEFVILCGLKATML